MDSPSTGDLRRCGAPLTKSNLEKRLQRNVCGRSPIWRSRPRLGESAQRCSPSREGLFPRVLATSRTCLPAAVNRKAKEFRSTIYLAPQTGLGLGTFWLTLLVVFSEPGTQ